MRRPERRFSTTDNLVCSAKTVSKRNEFWICDLFKTAHRCEFVHERYIAGLHPTSSYLGEIDAIARPCWEHLIVGGSIAQHNVQEGAANFQVVAPNLNQPELPKLTHKDTNSVPRRTDHSYQCFLADPRYHIITSLLISIVGQQ